MVASEGKYKPLYHHVHLSTASIRCDSPVLAFGARRGRSGTWDDAKFVAILAETIEGALLGLPMSGGLEVKRLE